MSRKSATARRPTIAAFHASRSESLPSVAEIAVVSSVVNVDRQGAGLEHQRQVLRLAACRRCR